jgi:hypothetical protein
MLEDCLTELTHELLHEIRPAGLEPAPLSDCTSSKPVFLDFTIRCCLLEFDKKGDKILWSENLSNVNMMCTGHSIVNYVSFFAESFFLFHWRGILYYDTS